MHHPRRSLTRMAVILALALLPASFPPAQENTVPAMFARGMALIDQGRYREADPWLARVRQAAPTHWDARYWRMLLSLQLGHDALINGDHAAARGHFAAGLAAKESMTTNRDIDWLQLKRFVELTGEHERAARVKPDYVYRIRVLYIMHTDVTGTTNAFGRPVRYKASLSTNHFAYLARHQELLRVYVEALSRGRLSVAYDRVPLDATMKHAFPVHHQGTNTWYGPDYDSVEPPLAPLEYAGRKTYDTTLYYWCGGPLWQFPYASWERGALLAPYAWNSPDIRGTITFALHPDPVPHRQRLQSQSLHWVLFHEFFHHVERLAGTIEPQHAHVPSEFPAARRNFPAWVPDLNPVWTATEYSWYRYHFLNTVPARMEQLARERTLYPAWRNLSYLETIPERTDEHVYKTYTAALRGIPLAALRRAKELVDRARRLQWTGKHREAQPLFEQALRHNPYHVQALHELGWGAIALRTNDFARAERFYGTLARVFPQATDCFRIGQVFHDRNQPARAARYFRVAAARPDARPVYVAWLARALSAAGDAAGAAAALARIAAEPTQRAPLATIENRALDVAFLSGSGPDGEDTVALWKLWPPAPASARWRLVPAGAGHVRLVSDFHWRCLEARGDTTVLTAVRDAPAQEWRLVVLGDGQRRIVSRLDGRSLAVVPGAGTARPALALQPATSGPYQKWALVISDPLVGSAETVRPAVLRAQSGLVLNLWGGSQADGTRIGLWDGTRKDWNSQWKLIPARDAGWVLLLCPGTKKCVGAVTRDGHTVPEQQTVTQSDTQLWKTVPAGDGRHRLVNKASGMALQVDAWDKHALVLLPVEDTAPQLWKIEY